MFSLQCLCVYLIRMLSEEGTRNEQKSKVIMISIPRSIPKIKQNVFGKIIKVLINTNQGSCLNFMRDDLYLQIEAHGRKLLYVESIVKPEWDIGVILSLKFRAKSRNWLVTIK